MAMYTQLNSNTSIAPSQLIIVSVRPRPSVRLTYLFLSQTLTRMRIAQALVFFLELSLFESVWVEIRIKFVFQNIRMD